MNKKVECRLEILHFGQPSNDWKSEVDRLHHDMMQKYAYEIFLRRQKNNISGNAFSDWMQAKKENEIHSQWLKSMNFKSYKGPCRGSSCKECGKGCGVPDPRIHDFEKRIQSIYETCHTMDQINQELDLFQAELTKA